MPLSSGIMSSCLILFTFEYTASKSISFVLPSSLNLSMFIGRYLKVSAMISFFVTSGFLFVPFISIPSWYKSINCFIERLFSLFSNICAIAAEPNVCSSSLVTIFCAKFSFVVFSKKLKASVISSFILYSP